MTAEVAAFWEETTREALAAPLDYEARAGEVDFRGVNGDLRRGWIAGEGAPAFLWIPPYGRESKLPDAYGTRAGFTTMSFNLHGEDRYHQEKYRTERGYFAEGIGAPETWIFRRFYQDCVLALRILAERPGVDPSRLGASGMSQGGGLSIWLAAFCPLVKIAVAEMPFLVEPGTRLRERVLRYPMKEIQDAIASGEVSAETVDRTVGFFDTALLASRVTVPTQVSLGLRDPACPPASVRRIYEALAGPKRLIEYPGGHDYDPGMQGSLLEWFDQNRP